MLLWIMWTCWWIRIIGEWFMLPCNLPLSFCTFACYHIHVYIHRYLAYRYTFICVPFLYSLCTLFFSICQHGATALCKLYSKWLETLWMKSCCCSTEKIYSVWRKLPVLCLCSHRWVAENYTQWKIQRLLEFGGFTLKQLRYIYTALLCCVQWTQCSIGLKLTVLLQSRLICW